MRQFILFDDVLRLPRLRQLHLLNLTQVDQGYGWDSHPGALFTEQSCLKKLQLLNMHMSAIGLNKLLQSLAALQDFEFHIKLYRHDWK